MDYTLMVAGFSFTVGVMEEHDTASVTEMADAPERMHKMATTATGHIITAIHESGKVTASHCEPNQVSADLPESHHGSAVHPESLLVSATSHHSWSSRVTLHHSWSSRDLSHTVSHTQIFKVSASSSQSGVQCEGAHSFSL